VYGREGGGEGGCMGGKGVVREGVWEGREGGRLVRVVMRELCHY
jgi:hypothetical protein